MKNIEYPQSLLRVLKNFFQNNSIAALCKVRVEQMYKECKNKTNNYII